LKVFAITLIVILVLSLIESILKSVSMQFLSDDVPNKSSKTHVTFEATFWIYMAISLTIAILIIVASIYTYYALDSKSEEFE
jgi:uncharacterized membrane protein